MRVVLFKGKGRQAWRIRLIGANNQILTQSEGYLTKWNAKRAARRIFPGVPLLEGQP
jgi:uncharacterized protein YegP (UPF0339 family)